MKPRNALVGCALTALAVVACGGCSAFNPDAVTDDSALNISDSNPWKAEVTRAFHESDDPFVRQVLADGLITDEEHAEAQAKYGECLKRSGLGVDHTGAFGGEEIYFLDGMPIDFDANAEAHACMRSTGQSVIAPLYVSTKTNPENDPGRELQCLKDRGAVDPGVTVEQYTRNLADWNYMTSLGQAFDECARVPKGPHH